MKHYLTTLSVIALIALVPTALSAAEASESGTAQANAAAPTPQAGTPTPADNPSASISEEESDHKKEKKFRLSGRLEMKDESDESKKTDKSYDGLLFTTQGATPFKARDEDVLVELRTKNGKTVTLEGRVKEPEGEDKWLLVQRIVERSQPPMGMRNPRGL